MLTRIQGYFDSFTPRSKVLLIGCFVVALVWSAPLLGVGDGLPFNNPQLECPPSVHTHPTDSVYEGSERRSLADLQRFCITMLQTFSEALMSRSEAAAVQATLQAIRDKSITSQSTQEQQLHFWNDYYPVAPRLFEDRRFLIPQRVMLKKLGAHTYEIFYYAVECGVHYQHQEVMLEKDIVTNVATIASWSTITSC